jgi:uncharacterized protein YbjT (DUF2867 family)
MTRRTNKKGIILVTGATGRQGGYVARRLMDEGWSVRALTRDPEKPAALALGSIGAEVVKGDYDDPRSIDRAVKGVYGVFGVFTPFEKGVRGEVRHGMTLIDASAMAGVKHFVYSSVAAAQRNTGIPHFESKREIELHLQGSGLASTILRPVFYMYNFDAGQMKKSIIDNGLLRLAIKPGRKLQMLAPEDMAAFVSLAFENPSYYVGMEIELAGDELTMTEAAGVMSETVGRTVAYAEQPIDELRKASEDMALMFEWFNKERFKADIDALRKLNPGLIDLKSWLRQHGWTNATIRDRIAA